MLGDELLSSAADHVYEAALVPEHWPVALDRLGKIGGARGAVLFSVSDGHTNWTASQSVLSAMQKYVDDGWASRNTRLAGAMRNGLQYYAGFTTELDCFDPGEIDQDRFTHEFLIPHGLGRCAGTIAHLPHGDMLCYSLERDYADGPASTVELSHLDQVRPHLVRAAAAAARIGYSRERTAVDTLDALGFPAVALSLRGSVTLQNARATLAAEWSIGASDKLIMASHRARTMLSSALSSIKSSDGPRSIPVPSGDGTVRSVLHLIPIRKSAHDIFTRSVAIAMLTNCDQKQGNPGVIQALFDLTPAEANVAHRIGAGESVEEIAISTGRSETTIRNQLARIYEKLGVEKQTELVRLLNRMLLPIG